jgi:hypothetical protein
VIGSTGRESLEPARRPLTDAERRLIRARVQRLTKSARRAPAASLWISAAGVFVLWLLTLVASDAPWPVVTALWLLVGGAIAAWVWRDLRRDAAMTGDYAAELRRALERNAADVYDITATRFVEFEEFEDEGASYAFELADGRIVFISGQEFYPGAKYPSLDFSLVYVLGAAGTAVEMVIDKRGARAAPVRTIPAATKHKVTMPEHLEVRRGRLDEIERWLVG